MSKVLEYAKDYMGDNSKYTDWRNKEDGASLIAKMLFEEATDINFYVGRAVKPANKFEYQNATCRRIVQMP